VEDGKTGFIVRDVTQMAEAIKKIDSIDPVNCRKHVEEKFGVKHMVDSYENIYGKITR
jgi:glycosyltransferase involved in cell wall biosynthesis